MTFASVLGAVVITRSRTSGGGSGERVDFPPPQTACYCPSQAPRERAPFPAWRLSETRVYGYLLVMRPVCGSRDQQSRLCSMSATCPSPPPGATGPLRKAAFCCRTESVTPACVALFQIPTPHLLLSLPCAWHWHCSRQRLLPPPSPFYLPRSCTACL